MTHPLLYPQQPQGARPAPAGEDRSAAGELEERVEKLEEQITELTTRLDRSEDWHGVYD
jgi:uncharacterized protein YceH (UPF0502 family)